MIEKLKAARKYFGILQLGKAKINEVHLDTIDEAIKEIENRRLDSERVKKENLNLRMFASRHYCYESGCSECHELDKDGAPMFDGCAQMFDFVESKANPDEESQ